MKTISGPHGADETKALARFEKSFALLVAGDRECGRMSVRKELGLGTIEGGVELGDADRELIGYAFRADGYEVPSTKK